MEWQIVVTDEFEQWFLSLSDLEQVDILAMIDVLEIKGPTLGRPYADTLKGSAKIRNLKELRLQHSGKPYRILYAFDPKRCAVLLCGGRKNGKKDKLFHKRMIYLAEKVFTRYLKDEGLL